jgi:hypothetical protein
MKLSNVPGIPEWGLLGQAARLQTLEDAIDAVIRPCLAALSRALLEHGRCASTSSGRFESRTPGIEFSRTTMDAETLLLGSS